MGRAITTPVPIPIPVSVPSPTATATAMATAIPIPTPISFALFSSPPFVPFVPFSLPLFVEFSFLFAKAFALSTSRFLAFPPFCPFLFILLSLNFTLFTLFLSLYPRFLFLNLLLFAHGLLVGLLTLIPFGFNDSHILLVGFVTVSFLLRRDFFANFLAANLPDRAQNHIQVF